MKSVVIWVQLNQEQDELEKLLGDKCFSIRGATPMDKKVEYEKRWRNGERPILLTKASVMGWGMNWQHCNNMIFCGMDYSFESYYQAVRRMYRFGQEKEVNVYRVIGKNEKVILDTINRKKKIKDDMARSMANAMKDFQTNEIHGRKFRLDMTRQEVSFPAWVRSEETA